MSLSQSSSSCSRPLRRGKTNGKEPHHKVHKGCTISKGNISTSIQILMILLVALVCRHDSLEMDNSRKARFQEITHKVASRSSPETRRAQTPDIEKSGLDRFGQSPDARHRCHEMRFQATPTHHHHHQHQWTIFTEYFPAKRKPRPKNKCHDMPTD